MIQLQPLFSQKVHISLLSFGFNRKTYLYTFDASPCITGVGFKLYVFMKKTSALIYPAFLAFSVLLGLTSCGDLEQNLKINADGSGSLETSIDVGEMMSMTKSMGDMGSLNNEDVTISSGEPQDTASMAEEPKDPMQAIIDKVTDPAYPVDFDTLIPMTTLMPDSVKAKVQNPALLDKIVIRLKSPANSGSLVMGIRLNFDNKKQLEELNALLKSMDENPAGMVSPLGSNGLQSESFLSFDADLEKGIIRIDTADYSGLAGEMGMSTDSLMTSEDLNMIQMMFGNSNIKSTVQVPGELISCSNPDAILTRDNKVILEYSFMDVIKKGYIPAYTIHFTPRK